MREVSGLVTSYSDLTVPAQTDKNIGESYARPQPAPLTAPRQRIALSAGTRTPPTKNYGSDLRACLWDSYRCRCAAAPSPAAYARIVISVLKWYTPRATRRSSEVLCVRNR